MRQWHWIYLAAIAFSTVLLYPIGSAEFGDERSTIGFVLLMVLLMIGKLYIHYLIFLSIHRWVKKRRERKVLPKKDEDSKSSPV